MKKWRLVSTKQVYKSEYLSLFDDAIILPTGREITYARVELKDFVSILPVIGDDIVMIEVFRYPANRFSLEIPSGYVEKGEDPEKCAGRELLEEAGYVAGTLENMGWFHPWTRSLRKAYLFTAKDLSRQEQSLDETELIRVKILSKDDVLKRLDANEIVHAPTIIVLQRFFLHLQLG
ncbi:MAG: NUDIX hydrolase [Candidatus Bathyarchaeota archaeon]|jgi:ADP-ribose pyrophosphatase